VDSYYLRAAYPTSDRSPAPPIPAPRSGKEGYGVTPERDAEFSTPSGHRIEPLYTEADLPADQPSEDRIGYPGAYPFTRGPYPSMYRGRLWTMRQFAGFGTVEETNERFHYLLDQGQTG
jgi:methylmalonyl-CoA mutase, N-terminal domain